MNGELVSLGILTLLVLLLGLALVLSNRKGSKSASGTRLSASSRLELSVPASTAMQLATKALVEIGAKGIVRDPNESSVTGWLGVTFLSMGQEVRATIVGTGSKDCYVDCFSRPRYAITLVNWGSSGRAVAKLANALKSAVNASDLA
jgi:hypothetical protein